MSNIKKEKIAPHPFACGKFGKVFQYNSKSNDAVVKIIECESHTKLLKSLEEIVFSFNIESPFLVRCLGYFIEFNGESSKLYIKMRKMEQSLEDHITRRSTPFSQAEIVKMLYRLAYGLKQLEYLKLYHHDIKPANILLDEANNVWIADFGLTSFVSGDTTIQTTGYKGTPYYSPPECGKDKEMYKKKFSQYTAWNLGVTMLEACLFGSFLKDKDKHIDFYLKQVTDRYGGKFSNILSKLLNRNSDERLSFDDVCKELEDNFSYYLQDTFQAIRESVIKSHRDIVFKKPVNEALKCGLELSKLQEFKFHMDDKLSVTLKEPQSISNTLIKSLNQQIRESLTLSNSPFIKDLSLNFSWCKNLEDICLESLNFKSIPLANLERIALDFTECAKLTDDLLNLFRMKGHNNLRKLEHLSLNLSGCEKITSSGLLSLVENLQGSFIKSLSLDFQECNGIRFQEPQQEISRLITGIKQLKNLNALSLDLLECSGITQKMKSYLRREFREFVADVQIR